VSRIGKLPVTLPSGVKAEVSKGRIKVTGPKGALQQDYDPKLIVTVTDSEIAVARPDDSPDSRSKHGLVRALIQNMVTGVTEGWTRQLEIQGVGYRATMEGKKLNLQVGFSHPLVLDPPAGIEYAVEGTTNIKVSGIDRQLVGQTAANVRGWRPPEPYKGKGIRYKNEYVRRKVGKTGTK
jgi:large subunit ribosomal protein L6